MKERPILFSAPMVRAILDGSKTQTRRVVKGDALGILNLEIRPPSDPIFSEKCLYGQPGDRLWVREKHRLWFPMLNNGNPVDDHWHVRYAADNTEMETRAGYDPDCDSPAELEIDIEPEKWRPSIYMPRWASRITLEITGVRVERLQDISPDDISSEGIEECPRCHGFGLIEGGGVADRTCDTCQGKVEEYTDGAFKALWQSIHGAESWAENPWLWVIEFKRI